MNSIKEIYQFGNGPSSSHTMGPKRAAIQFKNRTESASKYIVTLYGSLAATGKGHLSDLAILNILGENTELIWKPNEVLPLHPNALTFEAFDKNNTLISKWTAYSIGGGSIIDEDNPKIDSKAIYKQNTMQSILNYLDQNGISFWEYVFDIEADGLTDYLEQVWSAMQKTIKRGLENEDVLPGGLHLRRKASSFFAKSLNSNGYIKHTNKVFSYALAVAEENASGGEIVTAPTCGSAGILPAVLYHFKNTYHITDRKIIKALATAGLIGNLVKQNASISGAEVGCQGEVGTACAMAAAAGAQLLGGSPNQIEYAAEMGIEHHLGLTCDPVLGLVQIPCIERNAMGAGRAINCSAYALSSDGKHRISFDEVVETMKQTGLDMNKSYKETSEGGLAKFHK